MMPDVDGTSVLKIARRTYSSTQLPIIMATARHGTESVVEALELGANDYVTKPLDFPIVLARVKAAVGRKKAEDGMKRVSRQLEGILRNTADGVYGLDVEGRCTFVNPAAAALCGYDADDLHGHVLHDYLHPHRMDGTPCPGQCPLQEVLADGQIHEGREVLWHRRGDSVLVQYVASPIRELDSMVGAVVTLRRLRPVDGVKEGLVRVVRDNVRPALAAVHRALDELAADASLGPQARTLASSARQETDHVQRLLSVVVDLEELVAGVRGPSWQLADAATVLEEAISPLRSAAEAVDVTITALPQPMTLSCDDSLVVRALQQLIRNAIRCSPRGSVVQVGVHADGGSVVFWVEDQGMSVPRPSLDALFELAAQVDSFDPESQSAGLGLAFCRAVAERHGGRVWSVSGDGQGMAFHFSLPAENAAPVGIGAEGRGCS
jgi:PAS domain S-box-containing protein